jgi:hypothetical protein
LIAATSAKSWAKSNRSWPGKAVELRFRDLDDFHPDQLLRQVAPLAALTEQRKRLLNAATSAAAAAELQTLLIPIYFQDETNSLVFWTTGFVARSLSRRVGTGMRLARASPVVQNPARLSLILKVNRN